MELQESEKLRNVDHLIDHYLSRRKAALIELIRSPNHLAERLWGVHLVVDKMCGARMGLNPQARMSCLNCTCLGRLTDNLLTGEIMIEYGRRLGRKLRSLVRAGGEHKMVVVDERSVSGSLDAPLVRACGAGREESRVLKVDPVSAEVLVTWCINQIDPETPQLLTAYQCHNNVYLLREDCAQLLEMKDRLTEFDIRSMVVQLIATLRMLSPYSFTHGCPDMAHINLTETPLSRMIEGLHITGEYKFSLEIGSHSSLTVEGTRISPSSDLTIHFTKPKIVRSWISGPIIYTVEADTFQSFKIMRRGGTPLYPGSFELYCFLVGLMTEPRFRQVVEMELGDIWSLMWIGNGDIERLNMRLKEWGDRGAASYQEVVIELLSGLWLRCDVLDLVWNHLRRGQTLSGCTP